MIKVTFAVLDVVTTISFICGIALIKSIYRRHSIHLFVLSWISSLGLALLALSNDDFVTLLYPLFCLGVNSLLIHGIEKDNLDKVDSNR